LERSMSDSSLLHAFANISKGLLFVGNDWKKILNKMRNFWKEKHNIL
jgi:hypothetical protein